MATTPVAPACPIRLVCQGCLKVVISPSKADSSVIWLATEACF